jgi:Heterokaryon incompatibility protein (HET)
MEDSLTLREPTLHLRPITSQIPPHQPTDRDSLYESLQPWQTRLVKLLPGTDVAEVSCELHVVDIVNFDGGFGLPRESRIQAFEAISYSWGRPDLMARVNCNSVCLLIPPPPADALRSFRLPKDDRWVWCDAICVNQLDTTKSRSWSASCSEFSKLRETSLHGLVVCQRTSYLS